MNWTLRSGPQVLRQHNYMIFRYLAIEWSDSVPTLNFSVGAWGVKYEYVDGDSSFASDNATLDAVYELARWTLDGGVVDTYTDSNSRERRPYECDGLVAATNRALVQNDAMWARHSHAWVLEVPTWPIEWQQMSALLAWHDYQATGSTDVFETYARRLHQRTQVGEVDGTGLVNTSRGRHIVAWDPPPTKDMFVNNAHTSVCNSWAVLGLTALAEMAAAAGDPGGNASAYAAEAAGITHAMATTMWDTRNNRYCDGPCADPAVNGHGGVTTNYFTLYAGLVPAEATTAVSRQLAAFGLNRIGDYGSFVFLSALARYTDDDGSAVIDALTKCDADSWCHEIRAFNATMTTESLGTPHATMSHPWGTAAIGAIAHGVMGVQQTAPAWATFTVKPRLGDHLTTANMTVPTIRGPIVVAARPGWLSVEVPCNTRAKLCVQQQRKDPTGDGGGVDAAAVLLMLDGELVQATSTGRHWCTSEAIGCATAPRVLSMANP